MSLVHCSFCSFVVSKHQEKVTENRKLSQKVEEMEKSVRDMQLRFEYVAEITTGRKPRLGV